MKCQKIKLLTYLTSLTSLLSNQFYAYYNNNFKSNVLKYIMYFDTNLQTYISLSSSFFISLSCRNIFFTLVLYHIHVSRRYYIIKKIRGNFEASGITARWILRQGKVKVNLSCHVGSRWIEEMSSMSQGGHVTGSTSLHWGPLIDASHFNFKLKMSVIEKILFNYCSRKNHRYTEL